LTTYFILTLLVVAYFVLRASVDDDERRAVYAAVFGIIAFIDAPRLDRALVRYERAAERLAGAHATTPLSVLAGVDLLVVLTADGGARVREVAEISIAEDGYRPRLLFASGIAPVPSALVPFAAPTFVAELRRAGHAVLVDELEHAVPVGAEEALPAAAPSSSPPPPPRPTPQRPPPVIAHAAEPAPSPRFDPALEDAPPPGWELDRLGEEVGGEESGRNPEDAALAATFGLGPPPAPPGVVPLSADARGASGQDSTFSDALKRAHQRDEELAANDEEEER